MVRKFTQRLTELYVSQKIELSESLLIISHQPKKRFLLGNRVSETAEYLYQNLEKGNLLSNGIRTCPYINFDEVYVLFIALSESTGDLRQTLIYLNEKYERRYENKCKLMEALIYPFLVMILSIAACFFLCNFFEGISVGELCKTIVYLLAAVSMVIVTLCRLTGENRLYEAFLAIDFLVRSGVKVSSAVSCAIQIVGESSAYGKSFETAREKLEFGMSLKNSLKLGEKFEEGFYFAEKAGGKNEVFGKLALWMKEKQDKRRRICMSLIEPVFIIMTGLFLLTLVVKYFLPFITDFNMLQEV